MTTRARDVAAGATRQTFVFTATGGQTTFTGADDNGNTLQYNNDKVDIFLNGTRLSPADYTATDGTSIVLGTGTVLNDVVDIITFGIIGINSFLDINGLEFILDADGDTTLHASTDDQIDVKIGGNDRLVLTSGDIDLKNDGTVSGIKLYCESSNAHYARLQSGPHSGYSGNVSLTLPTTTDTLVGRSTTDTLTNKTIDASSNTISNIGDSQTVAGINANKIADGSVSNTEFQYLNGVTSNIQSQIDNIDTDIVNDTTPQLGGNLDLNSNNITGTGNINITGGLTISGDLAVNGTTTTINSTTLSVDDKNIELGATASPSDTSADGGGITLKGSTDHTFNWVNSTDAWTSSEHLNLASGKEYKINGTSLKDVTETLTNKSGNISQWTNDSGYYNSSTLSTILQAVYPVGSIYTNATNSTNPGTLLGFGTWAAFGAGRVPVGIDSGQTEFDTAEETGGAKTHTLSTAEIPSHYHLSGYGRDATPRYGTTTGLSSVRIDNDGNAYNSTSSAHTSSVGSGNAHNNLQPYIVVYMWKRTA